MKSNVGKVQVVKTQEVFDDMKQRLNYPPVWNNIKEFSENLRLFVLVGENTVSSILTSVHTGNSTYCVRSIASYPPSREFFANINILVDAMFAHYESQCLNRWLFLREAPLFKSTMRKFQINRDVASMRRYNTLFYGRVKNNETHNPNDFFFKLSLPFLDKDKEYVMVECTLKNEYRQGSEAFIEDYDGTTELPDKRTL